MHAEDAYDDLVKLIPLYRGKNAVVNGLKNMETDYLVRLLKVHSKVNSIAKKQLSPTVLNMAKAYADGVNTYAKNNPKKVDLKFKTHKPKKYNPDTDCPICFDKIKERDTIETDCGHIFCQKCIKTWFEQNNQCPYCRMVIVEETEKLVIKDDEKLGELITNFKQLTKNSVFKVWKMEVKSPTMSGMVYTPIKSEKAKFETSIKKIKEAIHNIKKHIVTNAEKKKYSAKQTFVVTRLWEYFYYSYIDIFADISYGYCITVHKSQGSTFDDVYIDSKNIMSFKNKDTLNCLYTAITRSSKSVKVLV